MSDVDARMSLVQAPRRISTAFANARRAGRKPLVIYLTASDPDFDTSYRVMLAAIEAGADILELGVPWSDPSADGPTIQAGMLRALKAGGGLTAALKLCRKLRDVNASIPIVLFGYANPIVVRGTSVFAQAARAAGADGVLCVDWVSDEDPELALALQTQQLDLIPLLTPTSNAERVRVAASAAGGFLYYVSMTGITGARLTDMDGPRRHVAEIRAQTGGRLPVVVGFGINTAEDARTVAGFADGVVVGSAAVRIIQDAAAASRDPVPEMRTFVASLRAALDGA